MKLGPTLPHVTRRIIIFPFITSLIFDVRSWHKTNFQNPNPRLLNISQYTRDGSIVLVITGEEDVSWTRYTTWDLLTLTTTNRQTISSRDPTPPSATHVCSTTKWRRPPDRTVSRCMSWIPANGSTRAPATARARLEVRPSSRIWWYKTRTVSGSF